MDFQQLTYSYDKVLGNLTHMGEQLLVNKACKVYIPVEYEFRRLLTLGSKITTLGIFLITLEDKYKAVFCAQAKVSFIPTATTKVKIGDDVYYEFYFEEGSALLESTLFVKDDTMPYFIYNTFVDNGETPSFIRYDQLLTIFNESAHYTGVKVGAHKGVFETVVATIARDAKDNMEEYRRVIKSYEDMYVNPPVYVPLSDPIYTASNTIALISGAYFENGLVTSLVKETKRVEAIESVLLQQ